MDYKVEDLVLYNEVKNHPQTIVGRKSNRPYIFAWEKTFTQEEKIAFIDKYYKYREQYGWATYLLDLINKFLNEKDSLPKDKYGYVKTVSLKAWLKKNDPREIIRASYSYGSYFFMSREYSNFGSLAARPLWGSSSTPYYNEEGKLADLWFHDLLSVFYEVERTWHDDHDDIILKVRKIADYFSMYGDFGIALFGMVGSNGEKTLDDSWLSTFNHEKPTVEEIDKMLEIYEEVDKIMVSKTDEIQKRLGWKLIESN